ncbi:MAG: hypothetical protein K2X82_11310 [Gemmataceae bacterium]|nr:hypothetical protein [Gemmataceae bacterium]
MRYRVEWVSGSWERLTDLLAGADPRVVLAAARLAAVLGTCPRSFGESRGDDPRAGFELPLGVWYEIDEPAGVVRVVRVWSVDRWPAGDDPADSEADD